MRAAVIALLAMCAIAAGENPFVGKWKIDVAKSDSTGKTIKFESVPPDMIRYTGEGTSYVFATDGKPYPSSSDRVVSVQQTDNNSWNLTTTRTGQVVSRSKQVLSADGHTLTVTSRNPALLGNSFDQTTVYERVGEGSGMLGEWINRSVEGSSPAVLEFADNGAAGLNVVLGQVKGTFVFDGEDHPADPPNVPNALAADRTIRIGGLIGGLGVPKFTLAARKIDEHSFEVTEKRNGRPVYKTTYIVSDDGKTITATQSPVGVNHPTKTVYNRQ